MCAYKDAQDAYQGAVRNLSLEEERAVQEGRVNEDSPIMLHARRSWEALQDCEESLLQQGVILSENGGILHHPA